MKKLCALLVSLALLVSPALLPAYALDAVTSATLDISSLPALRQNPDTNVLVIYFSTDDTVKAAAFAVAEALTADVFEIVPETPYSAADLAYYTGCRADREQDDSASRPAVKTFPESPDRYDVIFLGYPIWHGQAPRVLYTLLEGIDVSGKTIVPFCTSASSGAGSSAKNLQALTGAAGTWLDAKRLANHSTKEEIQAWALSLKLTKEESVMKMSINGTAAAVEWEDNDAVRALAELAAGGLTIRMSMYGGFEQVGAIGRRLPSADAQTVTASGDIVLYAGDQLVVFYGSNSWAYTRLGHITDKTPEEMRSLLGNGDVTITLTAE